MTKRYLYISEARWPEFLEDASKIRFEKGKPTDYFKYKAYIPRDIWNKYRPDKVVRKDFKEIKFGMMGYQQYHDLIGELSEYDHNDKNRRRLYKARHSKILKHFNRIKKDGTEVKEEYYSYRVPFTDEFMSWYFLW